MQATAVFGVRSFPLKEDVQQDLVRLESLPVASPGALSVLDLVLSRLVPAPSDVRTN